MNILVEFCFIQVVGGYVNVAQITAITKEDKYKENPTVVYTNGAEHTYPTTWFITGDKTPEDFINRIIKTCGGKSK